MRRRTFPPMRLLALLLAMVPILTPLQRERIESVVRFVMRSQHIAGLALGVERNGHTLFRRGYGYRDVGKRLSVDTYTIFRIGSVTKQFTATAILQLVEQRRLALRETLGTAMALDGNAAQITVRELLAQQSGLPDYVATASSTPPTRWKPAQLYALVSYEPLAFLPGSSWQYSNTNYLLLGRLLEATSGRAYARELTRRFLHPLDLFSTSYGTQFAAWNRAQGYAWKHRNFQRVPTRADETEIAYAAAGLQSNVRDLLLWLAALKDGRLLKPSLQRAMFENQPLNDGTRSNYGFGWYIAAWNAERVAEHPGYVDGFSADDAIVPITGLGVVVLTNASTVDLAPLVHSVVDILDGSAHPPVAKLRRHA